jgi:protein-S-isoprenylcysteine O-methyltransferase Ste14
MSNWSRIARRIRVPLGFGVAILYLVLAQPTRASIVAGTAIVILGLALRAISSGHVNKNEQLTTSGPYAYVRNPLYLGSLLMAGGFALAARNGWIVGILALTFLGIYLPVIYAEERFLQKQFPEFEEYSRHVPRLLPRLHAYGDARNRFSRDLYWKHREYNALLGAAAMVTALVGKLCWWPR